MANKTLLNGVNEVLKRVSYLAGDAGALTSLTDSARQVAIDNAVQVINESIDELYSTTNIPLATGQNESSITLSNGTRHYAPLVTDLSQIRWPMIDRTNGTYIDEYPGGYNELLVLDPRQTVSGLPIWGVIRPTDGQFYLFPTPDAAANGKVYVYQYDKDTGLSLATDQMPFGNPVFRALVPAWAEMWKRQQRQTFDAELVKASMGRASRLVTNAQERSSWSPR